MATTILRPTSTTSQTGWNTSNLSPLGDNNSLTNVVQTSETCNFTGVLADLDSGLSGATINNFTISLMGNAGRAGASTVALAVVHSSDGSFASENEEFAAATVTKTTSARTTQQDGSSALTFEYINALSVKMTPNEQGITARELFITVDYTEASGGYSHDVIGVAIGSIEKINQLAIANVGKVSGT